MPEIQIPLVKGQGKSSKNADYVDLLPTNIVPIVGEAEDAAGYFRFWPGITKLADANGVSRGSHWNTVKGNLDKSKVVVFTLIQWNACGADKRTLVCGGHLTVLALQASNTIGLHSTSDR